jgi:hypothetical protein
MTYPPINLAYLRTLTDCTGIIQHGTHAIPNRKLGYTTDDNARALIIASKQYDRTHSREDLDLAVTYLSFLLYARSTNHRFKNFMSYQRVWLDSDGTEDCLGRSLWACGTAASSGLPENTRIVAAKLFDECSVWAGDLNSPRARAYTIIGMSEYLNSGQEHPGLTDKINALGDTLLVGLKAYSTPDWVWFEPYMTYGNAILALGMLYAAYVTGNPRYMDAARRTIQFLTDTLIIDGRLEIIGNDGWYVHGEKRSWYDQQTIDAGYTVHLYMTAYKLLGDKTYLDLARTAYTWFFGNNRSGVWVYDSETCGCCDAITPWGLNVNQGSEACVSFLLAQIAMEGYVGCADNNTVEQLGRNA